MKKSIRIILSPVVYLFSMAALIVIPIGLFCLGVGLFQLMLKALADDKRAYQHVDTEMTFMLFTVPYKDTKQFIENGTFSD